MILNIAAIFQRIALVEVHIGMGTDAFEVPLVEGDTGPRLRFNLLDTTGAAVSGSAVNLYLSRAPGHGHSNVGHEACSGFNVALGLWDYMLHPEDVSGAGTFFGDVQVTYGDGTQETAWEAVRFLVRPSNKE